MAGLLLAIPSLAAPPSPQSPPAPPDWQGCWTNGSHTETWIAGPGIYVGAAAGGSADKPFYEQLRLERRDGVWHYVAHPSGQAETAFPLTDSGPHHWVFERPDHDFPQRIRVDRDEVQLEVRVESLEGRGFGLALRRCEVPSGRPPEPVAALPCDEPQRRSSRALERAAEADQVERRDGNPTLARNDIQRLALVHTAVLERAVCTLDDAFHAGVVLQHAPHPEDHRLAYHFFTRACQGGRTEACTWAPLAWDRFLVSQGRPQWYGSQWVTRADGQGWCAVAVDPEATDADRQAAGHGPIEGFWAKTAVRVGLPEGASLHQLREHGAICAPRAWTERQP